VAVDSLKVLDPERPIREATEIAWRCNMSRWAKSGCEQVQQCTPLFNHLVSEREHLSWYCKMQ
jgi:hypothetical protein